METFWRFGYEGTTLLDLQKAMGGIAAPSFYAAFGSKEKLFKEAVELHSSTVGATALEALTGGTTARVSIEGLLRVSTDAFTVPGKPRGCMIVLGAMNCSQDNQHVHEHLRSLRLRRLKFIRQRIERGQADGDVPKAADAAAIAAFYDIVMDGLSIRARDGASRAELSAAIDCAMAAWDVVVGRGTRSANAKST